MMLAETLRAELARIDGIISRLRWRRARLFLACNWPITSNIDGIKAINEEIRMWKRYRQTLF
jgi:hypothetical protein